MRAVLSGLAWLHRYLGIGLCLLFAMWFGTGIVMVFVPYPALLPQERFAGLQPLDVSRCCVTIQSALARSGLTDPPRQVRMSMVGARPVFHFHPWQGKVRSVYADTGEALGELNAGLALAVAQRFMPGQSAKHAAFEEYDQWSVPNRWNAYRPFHRIAMNDAAGTELYISALSGEVVRDTTRLERGWNWVGSVLHWIYPTALRKHPGLWDQVVWWLALAGVISAVSGAVLGVWRFRFKRQPSQLKRSPFRGWMYWHHVLGLVCMIIVLTWIVSGWLSMDHGRLFSEPSPSQAQEEHFAGGPLRLSSAQRNARETALIRHVDGDLPKEIELRQFAGTLIYVLRYDAWRRGVTHASASAPGVWPRVHERAIATAAEGLLGSYPLAATTTLETYDTYYYDPKRQAPLPVVRLRFDDPARTWFHVDPSSALLLERMDSSRRAYRWWYDALHKLDLPVFQSRPVLRRTIVTALCALGFAFSITGSVIGWRRLTRQAEKAS